MAITRDDIALYAKRIRPYFPEHLRDTAERLAYLLAEVSGARAKELRPDTPLATFIEWIENARIEGRRAKVRLENGPKADSLDQVELIMALEEELQIEVSDAFAERWSLLTFQDLVEHVHRKRGPLTRPGRAR